MCWRVNTSVSVQRIGTGHLPGDADAGALHECDLHRGAGSASFQPLAFHRGTVIGHLMPVLSHLARAVAATRRDLAFSTGPTHAAVVQPMRLSESQAHPPLDLTELAKSYSSPPATSYSYSSRSLSSRRWPTWPGIGSRPPPSCCTRPATVTQIGRIVRALPVAQRQLRTWPNDEGAVPGQPGY